MDVLADWQRTRSPKLADALDAQGPDQAWLRVEKLPGSRAKTAILNLAKTVDDPRLATLYLRWLAQGSWPAPTAKLVWTRIFEHLARLRDVRAVAPLRAIAADLPPFVGEAHRAWVSSEIERTVKTLSAVKPTRDANHRPTKAAPPPAAIDPRAPVWAEPDDHELRQVVADALAEQGDPQGELITLQLRETTTPAQRKRVGELLAKHAASWLGPIGKLCSAGSARFEAGFPIAVAVDRRAVPRRDWEAALAAPQWATIRRLSVSTLHTPKWWITAWVGSPAARRVLAFEAGALRIERATGEPWRITQTTRGYTTVQAAITRAFLAGLSPSERARVTIAKTIQDRANYLRLL